jgi:RNA polymerase primary sigma factor
MHPLQHLENAFSPEEEREIGLRAKQGDEEAKQKLIVHNLRLAVKIANDYKGRGPCVEDLMSVAFIGVMESSDRFDPDRGKFSVLAQFHIRNQIRECIARDGFGIKKPVHYMEAMNKMARTVSMLEQELERSPTDEEVVNETGLSLRKVRFLRSSYISMSSLDDKVGEDDATIGDAIADPTAVLPDRDMEGQSVIGFMMGALEKLAPREKEILLCRFGIGRTEQTLDDLGETYGLSRERIRQIQDESLTKIRKYIQKTDPLLDPDTKVFNVPEVEHRRTCPACGRTIFNGDKCYCERKKMRTVIAGSRTLTDPSLLEEAIRNCGWTITTVVSGKCRGVDALGEEWAKRNNIPIDEHPANWVIHGLAAGPIRNREMAQAADALIAIRKGKSKGTTNMINEALALGLKVHVVDL